MKLSKTQNAKRNIIAGVINKVITMILPFVVRSVIIYKLSADYLGLNNLFSSILQVLNLSEMGFSNAVVYSMYKPIADNDSKTICALMNFYRKVYRVIGFIVLGVGLLLLPFLGDLINGDYPQGINIYYLYLFYLVNTVLSYWMFAYKNAILNAFQRTDIISNVNTISLGGMYVAQIIILFTIRNYYLYVAMMPFFTVFQNLLIARESRRLYPKYVCEGTISDDTIYKIKKQVSGLMISKICAVSRNSLDSIFVSAFLGLTITAMYGNYYYVMNAVVAILNVIGNAFLAGVGNSIVTESREKNYSDLMKINFIYMWLSGWCTVCLLCLYQPFMELWVGEELMFSVPVVILFCIYFYSLEMGVIRGVYSDAAGLWWENRYRAIAESVANFVLNYIFGKFFGIAGIIFATLVSLLVINYGLGSQIVFKYYFKNGKLIEYFKYHSIYAFVTLVVCGVTYFITVDLPLDGILGLVVRILICGIVPNIISVLVYYKTRSYSVAIPWLLKVLHLNRILSFLIPKI